MIDAGNILFSIKGEVTVEGYKNLIRLIEYFNSRNMIPIVIIHTRHLKKRFKGKEKTNEIVSCIDKIKSCYSKFIFETPYNKNDDFYIIYTALLLECQVITNDHFRDHIYKFRTNNHESDENIIENYIEDLLVKYSPTCHNMGLTDLKLLKFSKCIQFIDKMVYIPTTANGFIKYGIA